MSDYNELRRAAEQAKTDQQEMAVREINGELEKLTERSAKWQRVTEFGLLLEMVLRIFAGGLVGSFLGFAVPSVISGKSSVAVTGLYAPLFFAAFLTVVFFVRLGLFIATSRAHEKTQARLNELRLWVDKLKEDEPNT